jgi:anti-sigma B factor antagonist
MALHIKESENSGINIVALSGRLVLGEELAAFQDRMDALTEAGVTRLLLDLAEVSYVDSSGLGALVALHSRVKRDGGVVKLVHVGKKQLELLILTKLIAIFPTFDKEQDAIDSFFPDRERKRFDILEFVQRQEPDEPIR